MVLIYGKQDWSQAIQTEYGDYTLGKKQKLFMNSKNKMDLAKFIKDGELYNTHAEVDKYYLRHRDNIEKETSGMKRQVLKYFKLKMLKAKKCKYLTEVEFKLNQIKL